ncbi:MAG: serine hydrolase [Ignavibacteriales bacterium]|nr:serine hydrolase [Ignavibacteriales bacterium]
MVQCIAVSQSDPLKQKFINKLSSIIDGADAVVGVAMKDLKTGEEISINADEIFPQASSIKIHILAELYRQAEQGKFHLSDVLSLPEKARVGGSGVLNELGQNSVSMSIRDYAVLMIVLSDNTATNALIDLVGMENVNKSLRALGATKTKLQRVMMDIKAAAEGRENIGTPKEVMMVLEKLYTGEIISKAASDDMLSILRNEKSGAIKAGLPPNVEVANKEGEVEGIRCDVGIVYLPQAPYLICVMTKLLAKDDDGPKIITEISRVAYSYFERKANSNQYGRRIPK